MGRTAGTGTIASAAGVVAVFVLTGCRGDGRELVAPVEPPPATTTTVVTPEPLQLFAPWAPGEPIPARYGCGSADLPALTWANVPAGTVELAMVVSVDGQPADVLAGIPAEATGIGAGNLPAGSFWWPPSDVGRNWSGLCDGTTYEFTLDALNQQLEAADDSAVAELVELLTLTSAGSASVTGQLDEPPMTTTT